MSFVLIRQEFVFEMRCGMNEFDHRILALLKQERERPEKFSLSFCLSVCLCHYVCKLVTWDEAALFIVK